MYSIFSPVKARGTGADPVCKVACNRGERRAPGARAGGPGRGWEAVNALNVSLWIRAWWQRCSPRHSRRHAQSNFCTCHGPRTKRFSSQTCVCVCVTLRQRLHVPQGQAQEGAWVLGTGPSPVSQHPQRFKNLISVELHPRCAG